LDAQGNWSTFTNDGVPQSRTHNRQNQVTAVGTTNLTFDNNGNTLSDDTGHTFTYDAWNRLASATSASGTVTFRYDALNRRLMEAASGTTTDLYYSMQWQVLEERISGVAKVQYVWSPVYVDALVLRDRDTDGDGTLEQRLYAQQDANYNITALVDANGTVVERYVEDPYGQVTVLTANWADRGTTLFTWLYLHQGGRFENVSATYHFRYRDLSSALGRWLQRDPTEYQAGDVNLYALVSANPITLLDPLGLQSNEFLYTLERLRCEENYRNAMRFHGGDPDGRYWREYQDCLQRARALLNAPVGGGGGSGGGGRGGGPGGSTGGGMPGGVLPGISPGPTLEQTIAMRPPVPPPPGFPKAPLPGQPSTQGVPPWLNKLVRLDAYLFPNTAKLISSIDPDCPTAKIATTIAVPVSRFPIPWQALPVLPAAYLGARLSLEGILELIKRLRAYNEDNCYCCVVFPGEKKATLIFPQKISYSQCKSTAEGLIGSELWWCDTTPACKNPVSPN
jgi:RHS repeat-associated protein